MLRSKPLFGQKNVLLLPDVYLDLRYQHLQYQAYSDQIMYKYF
jgi:hypothetical protein